MTDHLCNAGRAVTCNYKRNVKPHTACVCLSAPDCPYREQVTLESHGSILVNKLKEVN